MLTVAARVVDHNGNLSFFSHPTSEPSTYILGNLTYYKKSTFRNRNSESYFLRLLCSEDMDILPVSAN